MNTIATRFAYKNRFEFNGEKSGVMAFSATPAERARCEANAWVLFGETVAVVSSYEYLGTVTPQDGLGWSAHLAGKLMSCLARFRAAG